MTTTFTTSSTFTRTHAAYLGSKIAADLRQMQLFYGKPADQDIAQYLEEVTVFLAGGYLESVSYGFKRDDVWIVALKYTVHENLILNDDRSGRITPGADITGTYWYSFLTYTNKYHRLSETEKEKIKKMITIKRSHGVEPRARVASLPNKSYSNGGVSVQRTLFIEL